MDYKQIRAQARLNLKESWGLSIGVAAVAVLLGGLIQGSVFLPDYSADIPYGFLRELTALLNDGIRFGDLTFSIRNGIIGIVAFIVGGAVQLGHARFLLNQHDKQEIKFDQLFSQFHRFGQGFAQKFLRGLYITLWTLCLVIPGIMAAYSYSMTPFLMAEDENLTASEAITRSKEMMRGHRMELFVLDLTFIGWQILCAITANLGFLLLNPYTSAAHAVFYRQLQQKAYLPEF